MVAKPEQSQSLHARQELKLYTRIEQANLLEMPEEEFHRLVAEIEKSPLYNRLHRQEKIVRYQRFPRTDISHHFYELKEELVAEPGSLDVESLLANKLDMVNQIKELGLEKFKQLFLYPEPELAPEEIAQQCRLDISEVRRINELMDELSIASEFYHPSAISPDRGTHYSKIASVERGPEGFIAAYFSPAQARGRFAIDYERFGEMHRTSAFTKAEVKEIRQLFRKLELINNRKDTIYQILNSVIEKQALYFDSGDPRALLPLTQKELAKRLGLAPSSISRAIACRSIDTPWGEKPLKDFFPRPKRFRKESIKQLIEAESSPVSDEAIRARLEEKFGVCISRRAVTNLRKELRIPSSRKRKKNTQSSQGD